MGLSALWGQNFLVAEREVGDECNGELVLKNSVREDAFSLRGSFFRFMFLLR
jgi:hypothetical protein